MLYSVEILKLGWSGEAKVHFPPGNAYPISWYVTSRLELNSIQPGSGRAIQTIEALALYLKDNLNMSLYVTLEQSTITMRWSIHGTVLYSEAIVASFALSSMSTWRLPVLYNTVRGQEERIYLNRTAFYNPIVFLFFMSLHHTRSKPIKHTKKYPNNVPRSNRKVLSAMQSQQSVSARRSAAGLHSQEAGLQNGYWWRPLQQMPSQSCRGCFILHAGECGKYTRIGRAKGTREQKRKTHVENLLQ